MRTSCLLTILFAGATLAASGGLLGNAAVGVPSAPQNVKASSLIPASISISWDPPTGGSKSLSGYIVYWISEDGRMCSKTVDSNTLSTTVDYLVPCFGYTVFVATQNKGAGNTEFAEGPRSTSVSVTSGQKKVQMDNPSFSVDYNGTQISWTEPFSDCPIIGYDVFWNGTCLRNEARNTLSLSGYDNLDSSTFSYFIENNPYTEYSICIRANVEGLEGELSCHVVISYPELPSEPLNVNASSGGRGKIIVTWDPPADYNENIEFFMVRYWLYDDEGEGNSTVVVDYDSLASTYTIVLTDLMADYMYLISIVPVTNNGFGKPSKPVSEISRLCPEGFEYYQGRCFYFGIGYHDFEYTYWDCDAMNAVMPTFKSLDDPLWGYLSNKIRSGGRFWVFATNTIQDGQRWLVDDSPVNILGNTVLTNSCNVMEADCCLAMEDVFYYLPCDIAGGQTMCEYYLEPELEC